MDESYIRPMVGRLGEFGTDKDMVEVSRKLCFNPSRLNLPNKNGAYFLPRPVINYTCTKVRIFPAQAK